MVFIAHPNPSIMAQLQSYTAASAQLATNIKKVVPMIQEIILTCKEKVAGCMQPAVDQIVDMCLKSDLAFRKYILGRNCGIHPENRAETGVDPFMVQNLSLKISLQGYSESKLENPMDFEPATPGTAASAQEMFMERNFKLSNDYLKTVPFHDVEYLPVTRSHTFAALNIIDGSSNAPVRGLHEELSTDGYKALKLCPSWKKLRTEGIVFRRELEAACPDLPEFLSKAGN